MDSGIVTFSGRSGIDAGKKGEICLEDWKVSLEGTKKEGQVIMRVTGRDYMENWIRSSPVRDVCLTFFGWQVITENSDESYLLRPDNERIRGDRRLWGSQREKWSLLADRLPGNLRLFALLWEDPPSLYWYDPEEDRKELDEWGKKYGIQEGFQTLYLYNICIDKSRRERGVINLQRQWKWRKKNGFFLLLNDDRAYCFESLLTDETALWTQWNYISQEITGRQPPLINIRANYECLYSPDSPWRIYLVISYHLTERTKVDLVKAACFLELGETVNNGRKPGEKEFPEWFWNREIRLCNAGRETLYGSGIAGEWKLHSGDELSVKMEVCGNNDFCNR